MAINLLSFIIIYPQLSSFVIISHYDLLSMHIFRNPVTTWQRRHRWGDWGSPARKAFANLLGRCWACWITVYLRQMNIHVLSRTFMSFWQRLVRGKSHLFLLTESWELVQIHSILQVYVIIHFVGNMLRILQFAPFSLPFLFPKESDDNTWDKVPTYRF